MLSDDAIKLAFGWFSFGSKATVTSNPPHANMGANRAALDELLAAKLITHEHETHYGADRHIFKGTKAIGELLQTERAKSVLLAALAHPNPSEKE
jgi:hypothetical protein